MMMMEMYVVRAEKDVDDLLKKPHDDDDDGDDNADEN